MRSLLIRRNRALIRTVETLTSLITTAAVPPELEPYRVYVVGICRNLTAVLARNLEDLEHGPDAILEDLLSNTQLGVRLTQLISARVASPILRASEADRVCLRTIGWLHQQHAPTAVVPAAFSDGQAAIWPFIQVVPIYFMPTAEQRGLLYQPLLFHEFGHLVYAYHQPEMDALVAEIQRGIEQSLAPASQRDDRHDEEQAARRQAIVDTWYTWSQELFCDAVGLVIGGPAFLYAFSDHLSRMERADFYRQPSDLYHSSHPVTRLRVEFLTRRARTLMLEDHATVIEEEWGEVGRAIAATEDYHGFYDARLENLITSRIDDMLAEASPRACTAGEARGSAENPAEDSPVALLNDAWRRYRDNATEYHAWEVNAVARLFATDVA